MIFFRNTLNARLLCSVLSVLLVINTTACSGNSLKGKKAEEAISQALLSIDSDKQKKVDKIVESLPEEMPFMGAILLAKDGKILVNKGFGKMHIAKPELNTPKTIFQISNITMQFTAAAIMKLQEQGKLNVKDKLSKYVPDYPKADEITIHQLMTHTSGTPNESYAVIGSTKYRIDKTPEGLIKSSEVGELVFEPGTAFNYSHINYYLLGYIIERASGMKYKEYMRENIFKPLNMNSTEVFAYGSEKFVLARGHQMEYMDKMVPQGYYNEHAANSIFSTVEDLYRWDRALYTDRLLKKESIDTMTYSHVKDAKSVDRGVSLTFEKRDFEEYGYGFGIESIKGHKVLINKGIEAGFQTAILRFVDEDAVIIILGNTFESLMVSDSRINELVEILFQE